MVKTQFDAKIQTVRYDNEKEYFNQYLTPYVQEAGILHYSSCNDTPKQNEVAKRKNRR